MDNIKSDGLYVNRWVRKLKFFEMAGNKCKMCGDKNINHLVFHHRDPKHKEFKPCDLLNKRFDESLEEIEKCILLCENCHREIHYNDIHSKFAKERRNTKEFLISYKGNKCEICGYDKCNASLVFHHKDGEDKVFNFGNLGKKLNSLEDLNEKISKELNKCVLLCQNCHNDEHFDKNRFEKHRNEILNKSIRKIQCKINRNKILEEYRKGNTRITDLSKIFNTSKGTISPIIKKFKEDGLI